MTFPPHIDTLSRYLQSTLDCARYISCTAPGHGTHSTTMYFSATVAVTVLMALGASSAAVEDPACLPQPGEKHVHAGECCKVHYSVPETMMGSIKLCMKTQPLPSPHKHMDISLPALRAKFSCMGECVFQVRNS